jgi:hypothetical protein
MFYKTVLLIFFLIHFNTAGVPRQVTSSAEKIKWVINENSNLCVNGSTNINKFSCDILSYDKPDTLLLSKVKTNIEVPLTGTINLSVQSFDCHKKMMTRDLRKTLKQKQFPKLNISFLSLNKFPELTSKPEYITGIVDIGLAGVIKRYRVEYRASVDAENVIHLLGTRDVRFSDFNLIPPKKLGGIIQINDKLNVAFHLKMKSIDAI